MFEAIKSLFATAPVLAWSVVSVLLALAVMAAMWDSVRWWWMNTWMSFPVIGKIARYSKDLNVDPRDNTWFKSEKSMCSEYKKFVRVMDEHDYHEKVDYLVYAGDNGRSNMHGLLWPIIIGMVFVEAMGFSYVLAGFTIPGASENVQQMGAYGIAFLISGLLIFLTHFTGHELYRNSKINDARMKWQQDGREHKLETGTVPLSKPQSTDAGQPEYTRRINRIGSSVASYNMTIGTMIFVAVIAIGATYVRGQVLEKMLHDDTVSQTQQVNAAESPAADGLDMSSSVALPAADSKSDAAAQEKAIGDGQNTQEKGGWGTFIVLAFIFIGLQALGIFFGFRWGFAGQNSEQAFKAIGGGKFATYAEVLDHYNEVSDVAQSKLEDLQQRLMERNANEGTKGVHAGKSTFRDFMRGQREIQAGDRDDQRKRSRQEGEARSAPIAATQGSAATSIPEAHVLVEEPVQVESQPLNLVDAMNHIDSLVVKEDKKAYISMLPESLQGEIKVALKAAKENEKAKAAKLDEELEDLL